MPGRDFFARMTPDFAQHAGSAKENAERQASVERLLSKAEYECVQLRRELVGLVPFAEPALIEALIEAHSEPVQADAQREALPPAAAEAA